MKKQYILLLLALSTALSFTACGNTSQDASAGTVSTEMIVNTELNSDTESTVTEQSSEITEVEQTETTEVETESEIEAIIDNSEDNSNKVDSVTGNPIVVQDGIEYIFPADKYEIIDGCYKGVPLKGDKLQTSWELGSVFKASNGIEIKINDQYAYLNEKGELKIGETAALWMNDPDRDIKPGSEWNKAVDEFLGRSELYDTDIVDIDKLPEVTTTSEKRSSFNIDDEFQAYIDEWTIYHTYQATGSWDSSPAYCLHVLEDFAGSAAMGQGYLWEIERMDDYWKLTIRRNLSELNWDGILTCLKMVSPDAQEVFDNAIYEQFYNGCDWILDYDGWYDIPNSNSKIMVPSTAPQGEVWFYLK